MRAKVRILIALFMVLAVTASYSVNLQGMMIYATEDTETIELQNDAETDSAKSEEVDGSDAKSEERTDATPQDSAEENASAEDGEDSDADAADAESEEAIGSDVSDEAVAGTLVNTDTSYRVTVTFSEEAGIPEGAELIVAEKPEAEYIEQATKALDAGKVAFAVFLDISIVKDGEEIQPTDDVKVEVVLNEMPSDENGELAVVHFKDENDSEAVKSSAENDTVEFKTDGFSVYGFVYTVEFTYGEYTFAIEGGSEILLSEIFGRLHIEEDLTGSETECSAPELFRIDPVLSEEDTVTDWNLKSLEPFATEETLTVNLANGNVVVIKLTDDQPIETGYANPSGNVIWELYERGGERVMEFRVVNLNASDEEKAITKIQKEGSTARIANDDPLRTTTDKVIIHDGITGIGWTALHDTSGYNPLFPDYRRDQSQTGVLQDFHILKTVEIEDPSDIQRIGWSAFRRCYELKNINLSSMTNLKEILNQAFSPTGLKELDLSGCTSLELIGHGMCSGASYTDQQLLTSVKLPKNLKTIGSDAFYKCKNLKYVSFEDISSVTTIYSAAFMGISRDITNPIEYISDEATKQRAATRPAVRRLFTSVTSFPDNFIDFTGLDKEDWPLNVSVKDKTTTYNGAEQNGCEISSVPEGESDTCIVSGLKDGHKLSIPTDSPSSANPKGYTPSHGTNVAGSPYDNGAFADNPEIDAMYEEYDYGINYYFKNKTPGKLTITKAQMSVEASPYNEPYDGAAHAGSGTPSVTEGTSLQYRYRNGDTWTDWSDDAPSITDVGTITYKVRATNANYEDAVSEPADLKVTKKDVTVKVEDAPDVVYDSEPHTGETEYTFTGIVSGQTATITYTPAQGTNVATYTGSFGDDFKVMDGSRDVTDNYDLKTKTPGKLTITKAQMSVEATSYDGQYDGAAHAGSGTPSVTEGTSLQYRYRNGDTWTDWSEEAPSITDVGTVTYRVRATNADYEDAISEPASLTVTKRPLTISTGSAAKTYDGNALTNSQYSVTGLASGDRITVRTTGSQTAVGSSPNTYAVNWGSVKESNYDITEALGTLTVNAADNPGGGGGAGGAGNPAGNANGGAPGAAGQTANIADNATPRTDGTVINDEPAPQAAPKSSGFWALLNLIMTILTVLIALIHMLRRREDEESRLRSSKLIAAALAVLSIIVLILTENFTLPVHMIDKWTPLMALILVLAAAAAFLLDKVKGLNQE